MPFVTSESSLNKVPKGSFVSSCFFVHQKQVIKWNERITNKEWRGVKRKCKEREKKEIQYTQRE